MGNCFIIAEAGINHGGILEQAMELAGAARDAGASAVKFQTWFHDKWPDLDHLKFSKDEWLKLFVYCDQIGIKWFSTPFDFDAIDFLKECSMDIWKVPSGKVLEYHFIQYVCRASKKGNRFLASTGMCDYDEIINLKYSFGHDQRGDLCLLQCVTGYPVGPKDVNLNFMIHMHEDLLCDVGLSDHTQGIEIPIAAVALGAKVIEKHLTLDRNQEGPDHKASLEPHEFKEMVRCIRNVELAMGDGVKKPTASEMAIRNQVRERMALALL